MSPDPSATPVRVTVAVLTYLRPDDLRAVLPVLSRHAAEVGGPTPDAPGYTVDVVVVDNDPAGGAADVVAGTGGPWCRYVHEPRPGITAARNRAVDEAAASRLLVFVDDDERPHPGWLAHLLTTWSTTGAAAVAGRVVSEFAGELDPWIAAGGFFRRRQLATGTRIEVAATNNLLLDLAEVRRLGVRFDDRFGLSGGEDTLFTRMLHARGAVLVWCDEAVVTDIVPAGRMTRRSVLRRVASTGTKLTRTDVELAGTRPARVRARATGVGRGLVRLLGGAGLLGVGTATGSLARRARGTRTAARGLGMAAGAFGYVHQEYRRPRSAGPGASRTVAAGSAA